MNFSESVRYLLSLGRELAAPTQAAAAKFNLENIATLAGALGHPERAYPCAHIAGTNGKGSTAAFLASILRNAGCRTGLYTSPHLERINERIRVDDQEISDQAFAAAFSRVHSVIEDLLAAGKLRAHPTFFEFVTAIAFQHFADAKVKFAVFETGLGGRLDATNIVMPRVSVITPIAFDHENFLGHSLREIAGEKAGIIKAGVSVVLAEQLEEARQVLLVKAEQLDAPVIESTATLRVESQRFEQGCVRAVVIEENSKIRLAVEPRLAGGFQLQNALNAIAAARLIASPSLAISDSAIEQGIRSAVWPGRMEKVRSNPDIYLDGAHNPSASRELARFLADNFSGRRILLIFGALRDKAVDEIAGILFPHAAHVVFTEPSTPRSISATQLAEIAGHHAVSFEVIPDAQRALDSVLRVAGPRDVVFISGSLYLVGQLRSRLVSPAQSAYE